MSQPVEAGLFRWCRLNPGEGTILACARCGAMAHTSGLPADYPGINGMSCYMPGNDKRIWDWQERHECDPVALAQVAAWQETGDTS